MAVGCTNKNSLTAKPLTTFILWLIFSPSPGSLAFGASVQEGQVNIDPLTLTRVTNKVYSAIGDTRAPSYKNAGHNNNLSVVIGEDGVLVVNGGDNYLLAKRLHLAIGLITDQPVKWVVNENGQGHAFLGNSYWRSQKVPIIAQSQAVEEIALHGEQILKRMQTRNREKAVGTLVAVPEIGFEDKYLIDLGGMTIELVSFGPAHSAGDISVWLPEQKVLIAGDIAFHQRLLAIFPDTNVSSWIQSFNKMSSLSPKHLIPGHGIPTDIETVRSATQGYLIFLTNEVQKILDAGGDLNDAYNIDQSQYSHLNTFEELARKNAGRLYQTMEMEYF